MDRYRELRPRLPQSYVEFVEETRGSEAILGGDLGFVVIWDPSTIQERYDEYQMGLALSERWFPFGSMNDSEILCFDLSSATDHVHRIPYIGMSDEEAILVRSFREIAATIRRLGGDHRTPDGCDRNQKT